MSAGIVIAVATGAVAGWAFLRRRPSLNRELSIAVRSKDLTGVVNFLDAHDGDTKETLFNTATRTLWDGYERELATDLIKQVGSTIHTANIAQYWIKQALEVEPDIAGERFDPDWLGMFYNAEHAARCGKFG